MDLKNLFAGSLSAALIVSATLATATAASESEKTNNGSNSNVTSSTISSTSTSATTSTAEPTTEPTTLKTYNITFLDFDGKVLKVLEVEEGDPIDYTAVNTKSLHKHIDRYTEQEFIAWDKKPDFADADYTISALSKTASITFINPPEKKRYFSTKGNVSLKGLAAEIKLVIQKPEKDKNGKFVTEESIVNISESCKASPLTLKEAFAKSDTATITVYPLGDQTSLCKFDIVCFRDLGDVNEDGSINSKDASLVLAAYAAKAASKNFTFNDKLKKLCDVNMDNKLDARDASYILKYYAVESTTNDFIDWEYFFDYDKILGE